MSKPLRFAVVGAGRGKTFIQAAGRIPEQVKLVAVCDSNPASLDRAREIADLKFYSDYDQVLQDAEIDAVCIATPVPLHARQSILALEAGKHVLSEVTATHTIEEGWDLIKTVEKTGLTYMMAENYCFMRPVLMVQNMVEAGLFGEITFALGHYIHAVPNLLFHSDGELTWRGQLRRDWHGNTYPTHSLGPICRWLGINKTDKLKTTATWTTKSRAAAHYARLFRPDHPELHAPDAWKHNDSSTTMIQTQNGVLIESRFDCLSKRPHNMAQHELQGTKGCVASPIQAHEDWLVWLEGYSEEAQVGVPKSWQSLNSLADEWEHPLWRAHLKEAEKAGHGGGDYFVLREFAGAVEENRTPLIDVYDAVTWSSLTPLSQQSVDAGFAPVEVPDFAASRR